MQRILYGTQRARFRDSLDGEDSHARDPIVSRSELKGPDHATALSVSRRRFREMQICREPYALSL